MFSCCSVFRGGGVCAINAVGGDTRDGAVEELVKGVDLRAVGAGRSLV